MKREDKGKESIGKTKSLPLTAVIIEYQINYFMSSFFMVYDFRNRCIILKYNLEFVYYCKLSNCQCIRYVHLNHHHQHILFHFSLLAGCLVQATLLILPISSLYVSTWVVYLVS